MNVGRTLKSRFIYFSAITVFISITLLSAVCFLIANKIQLDDANKFLNTALTTAWSEFYYHPQQLKSYFLGVSDDRDLRKAIRTSDEAYLEKQIQLWRHLFPAANFWAISDGNGLVIPQTGTVRNLNQCYPHVVSKLRKLKQPIISTELISAAILQEQNPALAARARIYYKNPSRENKSFDDALVNVVFYPLLDENNSLIGILSGGFLLNNDSVIAREYTNKIPNTYLSIAVQGVRVVSNIDVRVDDGIFSHPAGTMQTQQLVEDIGNGKAFRGIEKLDSHSYGLVAVDPVKNSADEVIADLGVGAPINMLTPFKKQSGYLLVLIGLVDLGLAMLLSLRLSGAILAPIYRLKRLASGITNQTVETKDITWAGTEDPREISELASTIIFMAKDLKQKESEIKVYVQDLAEEKANLEVKVAERTSELVQALAELKTTNQYKSLFLANMSHELRTPLTSIIGFGKLLEEQTAGELTDRQRKYSQIIVSSGNQLLELINDILNLVKMEQCKEKVNPGSMSLCETASYVTSLFGEAVEKGRLKLVSNVGAELPQPNWDFRKIVQLLSNLLSNAVKFTPEDGCVELSAVQQGDNILIVVRDTGIGIKPENQKRVFLAFEQAESSYTRQYQGTGLGLSICKRIVEMHHGKIWLESKFGVGTSVFVLLPITPAFQVEEGVEAHVTV